MVKDFLFSKHYKKDKKIDEDLAINCVQTGQKEREPEPNKFTARQKYRKGELIVVYRDYGDYFFVITAFWNDRGMKDGF